MEDRCNKGYEWKTAAKNPDSQSMPKRTFKVVTRAQIMEGEVLIRRLPSEKYHPDCLNQRTRQESGSTGKVLDIILKALTLVKRIELRSNFFSRL